MEPLGSWRRDGRPRQVTGMIHRDYLGLYTILISGPEFLVRV